MSTTDERLALARRLRGLAAELDLLLDHIGERLGEAAWQVLAREVLLAQTELRLAEDEYPYVFSKIPIHDVVRGMDSLYRSARGHRPVSLAEMRGHCKILLDLASQLEESYRQKQTRQTYRDAFRAGVYLGAAVGMALTNGFQAHLSTIPPAFQLFDRGYELLGKTFRL